MKFKLNTKQKPLTMAVATVMAMAFTATPGLTAEHYQATVQLAPVQHFLGMEIFSNDGDEAGEIEYLLVDGHSGYVRFALISEGGELELEDDELVAIPFHDLDMSQIEDDRVRARANISQLRESARYSEDTLTELSTSATIDNIYNYYQTPFGSRFLTHVHEYQADIAGPGNVQQFLIGEDLLTTLATGVSENETATSTNVRTASADDFGKIENLVMNIDSGRIAYAVIGDGGFLGIAENHYAVPIQLLQWVPGDNVYEIAEVDLAEIDELTNVTVTDEVLIIDKSILDGFYQAFGIDLNDFQ